MSNSPEMREFYGIRTIAIPDGSEIEKAELFERIQNEVPGALAAPQSVDTMLINGGFSPPAEASYDYNDDFRKAVFAGQIALEHSMFRQARDLNKKLLVFNLGKTFGSWSLPDKLPDMDNYFRWERDLGIFENRIAGGQSMREMFKRFDTALHISAGEKPTGNAKTELWWDNDTGKLTGIGRNRTFLERWDGDTGEVPTIFEATEDSEVEREKTRYFWERHPDFISINDGLRSMRIERALGIISAKANAPKQSDMIPFNKLI
jgi:hypothetical protein